MPGPPDVAPRAQPQIAAPDYNAKQGAIPKMQLAVAPLYERGPLDSIPVASMKWNSVVSLEVTLLTHHLHAAAFAPPPGSDCR